MLAGNCGLFTSSPLGIPAAKEQTGIHRPVIGNKPGEVLLKRILTNREKYIFGQMSKGNTTKETER